MYHLQAARSAYNSHDVCLSLLVIGLTDRLGLLHHFGLLLLVPPKQQDVHSCSTPLRCDRVVPNGRQAVIYLNLPSIYILHVHAPLPLPQTRSYAGPPTLQHPPHSSAMRARAARP